MDDELEKANEEGDGQEEEEEADEEGDEQEDNKEGGEQEDDEQEIDDELEAVNNEGDGQEEEEVDEEGDEQEEDDEEGDRQEKEEQKCITIFYKKYGYIQLISLLYETLGNRFKFGPPVGSLGINLRGEPELVKIPQAQAWSPVLIPPNVGPWVFFNINQCGEMLRLPGERPERYVGREWWDFSIVSILELPASVGNPALLDPPSLTSAGPTDPYARRVLDSGCERDHCVLQFRPEGSREHMPQAKLRDGDHSHPKSGIRGLTRPSAHSSHLQSSYLMHIHKTYRYLIMPNSPALNTKHTKACLRPVKRIVEPKQIQIFVRSSNGLCIIRMNQEETIEKLYELIHLQTGWYLTFNYKPLERYGKIALRELGIIEGSTITMYRRLNGGMKKTQPIEMSTEKERSRTPNSKLDSYLEHGFNTKEIDLKKKQQEKKYLQIFIQYRLDK